MSGAIIRTRSRPNGTWAMVNRDGIVGAYVFWLLHHDGSERQRARVASLQRVLDLIAGWRGPMQVATLPEARRVYLDLCGRYGIDPEAA